MIKEIFTSIQGEGPYVGYKQLFIRFCGCNLSCNYCDTNFDLKGAKDYTSAEILEIINRNADCHSVSLTGGEPLLNADFINEFAPKSPLPLYLETNGTMYRELEKVIDSIAYIAADIKLPSVTGMKPLWEEHDKFFHIAAQKELFAKVVFGADIRQEEINAACDLCLKYNAGLILQPVMIGTVPAVTSDFMSSILNVFLKKYKNTRLIPQVHKFINVE